MDVECMEVNILKCRPGHFEQNELGKLLQDVCVCVFVVFILKYLNNWEGIHNPGPTL